MKDYIVSVDWLKDNLDDDNLVILDSSPISTANGSESKFKNQVIPKARHFDLKNQFSDLESEFPNTFPSPSQFEWASQRLGINKSSKIVIYDNLGIHTSPRVWWMFKAFGHEDVSVLNGGLPEWIKQGNQTVNEYESTFDTGDFTFSGEEIDIKYYEDILRNIDSDKYLLVDARSIGRFEGTESEPRKSIKSGHIPRSINIPYTEVLENGLFKSTKELTEIFKSIKEDKRELVFTCGSGVTACIILLASELVFQDKKYVFDGSWTEWATRQNLLT
ncbi:sulfurtransferase [Reichenbachiella versicolor]|uniref:sulfurtransferase n=1 Tax=Reichenbachiella versicolor TaxID=1821036 RepID=UPI000D6EACE0|nr:sulfurtransferase [Reichenbachiella versicolor]